MKEKVTITLLGRSIHSDTENIIIRINRTELEKCDYEKGILLKVSSNRGEVQLPLSTNWGTSCYSVENGYTHHLMTSTLRGGKGRSFKKEVIQMKAAIYAALKEAQNTFIFEEHTF